MPGEEDPAFGELAKSTAAEVSAHILEAGVSALPPASIAPSASQDGAPTHRVIHSFFVPADRLVLRRRGGNQKHRAECYGPPTRAEERHMYKQKSKLVRITSVVALTLAPLVAVAQPAIAGPKNGKFTRLTSLGVGTFTTYGALRSTDGMLHLIYQTTKPGSAAPDGLATRSISPSGAVGPEVTALTGWGTSVPGLVQLPGGTLEAVFGAVSPNTVSDIWGITSSDEGAHWAAPAQVGSGAQDEVQAYGAAVTGVRSARLPSGPCQSAEGSSSSRGSA